MRPSGTSQYPFAEVSSSQTALHVMCMTNTLQVCVPVFCSPVYLHVSLQCFHLFKCPCLCLLVFMCLSSACLQKYACMYGRINGIAGIKACKYWLVLIRNGTNKRDSDDLLFKGLLEPHHPFVVSSTYGIFPSFLYYIQLFFLLKALGVDVQNHIASDMTLTLSSRF